MSILNVWVEPERALVGVDTAAVGRDGAVHGHASKLLVLPHLNCVIAIRGYMVFFGAVFGACHMATVRDFDDLLDAMPKILSRCVTQAAATYAMHLRLAKGLRALLPPWKVDTTFIANETIVLVGWSERSGRMIGHVFDQKNSAEGFKSWIIEPHYIAPWHESIAHRPDPKSAPAMEALAKMQVSLLQEKAPEAAAGGRLIMCELRRDTMAMARGVEL